MNEDEASKKIDKETVKKVLLKYSDYDGLDYMEKVWEELELDEEARK